MNARQAEDTVRERLVIRSKHPAEEVNLDETQMGRRGNKTTYLDKHGPTRWSRKSPGPTGGRAICPKCGRFQRVKEDCPARYVARHECGKTSHFVVVCRLQNISTTGLPELHIYTVQGDETAKYVHIAVNDVTASFIFDIGAEVPAIPINFQKLKRLQKVRQVLCSTGNQRLTVWGACDAVLKRGSQTTSERLCVVEG